MPVNYWSEIDAAALTALDGLVYRSNLLGQDRSVCNIFGGNTSVKLIEIDHLGREVEVLWVKGSGSDVLTIKEEGFAGLRLAEIMPLMGRSEMSDEEMVEYLSHTTHALNRPRQSIETLLHGFTPAKHVDHTHPDAVISLACLPHGQEVCRRIWGDRMVWVDYIRPGFTLSKWIGEGLRANPHAECVVMGKHGLVTWGETANKCYENTLRIIQEAEDFIGSASGNKGTHTQKSEVNFTPEFLSKLMAAVRGMVSQRRPAILKLDQSKVILDFLAQDGIAESTQIGAACPDHLVHTKRLPLFIDWDSGQGEDLEVLLDCIRRRMEQYVTAYEAYFCQHSSAGDKITDPFPRIILIPGLGMITTGADATAADISNQLYHRAIPVINGSQAVDKFISLTPEEAYGIEYWPLELYKLSLKPTPKEMAGRVVCVTGGASGIGLATSRRLASDDAHVAILDLNVEAAQNAVSDLRSEFGSKRALAVACDVTDPNAVDAAFQKVAAFYGGVDIVVSNAGIAISAAISDTTDRDWDRTMDILVKGYFHVSRAAFRLWGRQQMGGSLIYVVSKNALYAGKNAAAYSAAKAAELHMARCLAEEGGGMGVRVNCVLPDAVIQGSGIWDAGWRNARASGYGIEPDELGEFYRNRTTLKVNVTPADVAEAISFLAGPRASRTTGGAITVDGGVAAAFVR